jgi:hypothetical protein
MTTEWRARRSRDRLLCGRKHPVTNEYVCRGEIAVLRPSTGGLLRAGLKGFVETPPGSGWWEPSVTSKEKVAVGRRPANKARPLDARGRRVRPVKVPDYPWRRLCPECNCTAVIDSAVLE